jgi:hypothetical protein
MILTIELPDETIIKHNILETTTLKEIAVLVNLTDPVFFCDRWKGELGTLMAMSPNDDPIQKFNTNSTFVSNVVSKTFDILVTFSKRFI